MPQDKPHGGIEVDHSRQQPRLKRIEGQVRGLQRMISESRPCLETAHQINAVVAALRRVQSDMIRDHLHANVTAVSMQEIDETERARLADEVADLLARNT